jgi:hypothetical protein
MDESKKKYIDTPEDEILGIKKSEIRESTIAEYRKGQVVRLIDVVFIGPVCIYAGIKYRKQLPKWLSISLVGIGAATVYYNAKNLYVNWKQDGKLIKEALKKQKEDNIEEKLTKIVDKIKTTKPVIVQTQDVVQEKKEVKNETPQSDTVKKEVEKKIESINVEKEASLEVESNRIAVDNPEKQESVIIKDEGIVMKISSEISESEDMIKETKDQIENTNGKSESEIESKLEPTEQSDSTKEEPTTETV